MRRARRQIDSLSYLRPFCKPNRDPSPPRLNTFSQQGRSMPLLKEQSSIKRGIPKCDSVTPGRQKIVMNVSYSFAIGKTSNHHGVPQIAREYCSPIQQYDSGSSYCCKISLDDNRALADEQDKCLPIESAPSSYTVYRFRFSFTGDFNTLRISFDRCASAAVNDQRFSRIACFLVSNLIGTMM